MNFPLIFLDIDGVMNRFPPQAGDRRSWPPVEGMNADLATITSESLGWLPEPLSIIQDLVNNRKCKIVISSSWRHYMSLPAFEKGLQVPLGTVIGSTKSLIGGRGEEIELWRKENNHTGPFVILDDDTYDMMQCESLEGHIVPTVMEIGLTSDLIPEIDAALAK